MFTTIFDILNKCNDKYSNGEIYLLSDEELDLINRTLNLKIINNEVIDETYDIIYYTLKQLDPNNAFFNKLTSNNTGFGVDIIHDEPMGSMEELKSGDWEKWKQQGNHKYWTVSAKLDGCSIILKYRGGKLYSAATRGHGIKGKCIMRHIPYILNIPKNIDYKDEIVIRGELVVRKDKILDMINEIQDVYGKEIKNARNAVAGALNAKDTNEIVFKYTDFVAYWTSDKRALAFDQLTSLGFDIPCITQINYQMRENDLINLVKRHIECTNYEIDGIILSQEDNPEEGFEASTINPKCSRKFKMGIYDDNAIMESTVTNINWQISRYGRFTPVIEIEPTEISGCTVTNITAHNYENLVNKKCGIGSRIKFCRSGLVIPYLLEVLTPSSEFNLPDIKTKIEGVNLVLDDFDINKYTIEMDLQRLVYFGKKLDIEQLGYGNCKKLYEDLLQDNLILDPINLLGLPKGYITEIIGENGKKIEKSLQFKIENLSEPQFAAALGIFGEGLGETILKQVFSKYNTLEVTEEQLFALPNFGEQRIEQYMCTLPIWVESRQNCLKMGIKFIDKKPTLKTTVLTDFKICFSGIRDKELSKLINENGGMALDTWKKDINYLVVKDKASTSSKIKKANENNIPVVTLTEMKEIIKNAIEN